MNDPLAWALANARQQTLALVADIPPERMTEQSLPEERHPLWILGHLLLGDTYLLSLLGVESLSSDFDGLLRHYGPGAEPTSRLEEYDSKAILIDRLSASGTRRVDAVRRMTVADLGQGMPDPYLAQAQPTIAHHLLALVCHEGYHAGQLSVWRRTHGLQPARWVFAPIEPAGEPAPSSPRDPATKPPLIT